MEKTRTKYRSKKKRLLAAAVAFGVVVSGAVGIFAFAEQSPTYEKDITIANVLTDFQYFVQDDFNGNGHIVGAVAVGGAVDHSVTFGDGQSVSSYLGEIVKAQIGSGGYYNGPNNAYYGVNSTGGNLGSEFIQNANYIDMDDAFSAIIKQSQLLADHADVVFSENDMTQMFAWTPNDRAIRIDVTQGTNFVIPWAVYSQLSAVDLIGYDSLSYFQDHKVNISVTGVPADATPVLAATYPGNPPDVVAILWKGESSDTYFKTNLINHMENSRSNEIFLEGFKLIWNFPDAKSLTTAAVNGHVVAPQANVNVIKNSGHLEGGVIAKNIASDGGAEAHYYSYFDIFNADEPAETTVTKSTAEPATTTVTEPATTTVTEPATTTVTEQETTTATEQETTTATEQETKTTTVSFVGIDPTTTTTATTTGTDAQTTTSAVTTTADLGGNHGGITTTPAQTTVSGQETTRTTQEDPDKTSKDNMGGIGAGSGDDANHGQSDIGSSKTGATITLTAIILLLSTVSITVAYKYRKMQ